MKNIFRIVMAVAILFTASCAKEDISSTIGGGEVEVTFTANLAGISTRAIADGTTVDRVYVAIFDATSKAYLNELTLPEGYPVSNGQASMTVVLLKDKKYDLVFWAQKDGTGAYTLDLANRKVKANYDAPANNEARDAFFRIDNNWVAGVGSTTFELRRPFAQINAGNSDADVKYAKANGSVISQSSMTVITEIYDTLDLTDGSLTGNEVSAEFTLAAIPSQTIAGTVDPTHDATLNASAEYNYLAMNYLLVNDRQLVDLVFNYTDGTTTFERKYFQVPVQRNYRTNILGQLISSPMEFNVIIVPDFIDDNDLQGDTQTFDVYSQDEFEDALAKVATQNHIQHLVINLYADVTLDVDAWQTLAIGNKNTKDITINGLKSRANDEYYTLTFNNTNSDWNNIATNGAKLILNNLNITNSGYGATDAAWNRHDLNFACEVEMNNVVSLNAIALKAGAKIENTTINDDHTGSSYAVWIQPNGQTVTINNCTIDSTGAGDGRGIKIDEQYVDAPAKVVLNVSETTFVTESKAAIVVKSKAGAEINASELDITGVAADSEYAVWVDEDAAAYYNLVEVTGAMVRLEGSAVVDTQDELNAAIVAGGYINLAEGQYTFNGTQKDITIIGSGNVASIILNQVNKTPACSGKNVNLKNVTLNYGTANYVGIQHSGNVSYKNCVINGQIFLYGTSEIFEDCVFNVADSNAYNVWAYGCANVTFKGCEFNCGGKSLLVYHEQPLVYNVTIDGCTFNASSNVGKAAVQMHTETGISGVLKINDTNVTGFNLWNELNNNTKALTNVFEKYVDGVQVYNDVIENGNTYTIYSAAGLYWLANEVNVNKNAFNGKTVKLAKNIDLQNATWAPIGQTGVATFNGVFDGQNYTISNLNVDSSAQTGKHYSSGLFGWVESHTAGHGHIKNVKIAGATIVGHHNCGALVGYITQETALVENCHVTGATISCTYANGDADGDKAGALIGNATVATPVKDCTAANSTVSAGRDAGQLIGAGREANVTGCSATNVTVTANGTGSGVNINNAVIGRKL